MSKFYYYLGTEQFQPEIILGHARLAEESGFDGLFISEHFHPWVDDSGSSGFTLSILGAITQVTQKVRLMTGVVTPLFRFHPALIAQAGATVDRLSGGRFDLGIGTGENINEGPLGYKFPAYSERADRMEEALQIIKRLLSGEKLTFNGEYYQTDRAKLYSPPTKQVKVFLAAGGEKSVGLALKGADGIITSVKDPAKTLTEVIEPARKQKPDFEIAASRWCVIAKDKQEALDALKPWRGLRVGGRLEAVDPAELREKADRLSPDEILSAYSIASNPDEITTVYLPLVKDLKADIVVFQTTSVNQEETIKLLGERVLPKLRQGGD